MSINDRRKEIDKIDNNIIKQVNKRAKLVKEIGKIKRKNKAEYYVPSREYGVYKRLTKANRGPLPDKAIKNIFREIMSASLALEKPIGISYLGPQASFTQLAAQEKFGASVAYLEEKNISDVFASVDKARSDYGVVPIENSTEGTVTHTLDMFVDSELKICSEILFHIEHNLMSRASIDKIKKIYSIPQVFGQCRLWLEANCSNVELIETSSTTRGAQIAAKDRSGAAIASGLAATKYDLKIIRRSIQDKGDNVTRFLVIGKQDVDPTGNDKTSVLFSVKDKVGVLHSMLTPFRRHRINLTKIESRPSKKKLWEYVFFVDFIGHAQENRVKKALAELEKHCIFLKTLGSYPMQHG